jgi:hypothetical protein
VRTTAIKRRIYSGKGFYEEIEEEEEEYPKTKEKMGVTKEQVESSLNSKLNPSHLVKLFFLFIAITILYASFTYQIH